MKRASRKRCSQPKTEPTPDVIRRYIATMADHHQQEWQVELTDAAPHWEYLLALHLRLVELERSKLAPWSCYEVRRGVRTGVNLRSKPTKPAAGPPAAGGAA